MCLVVFSRELKIGFLRGRGGVRFFKVGGIRWLVFSMNILIDLMLYNTLHKYRTDTVGLPEDVQLFAKLPDVLALRLTYYQ